MRFVLICLFVLDFIEHFWYDVGVPREVILSLKGCMVFWVSIKVGHSNRNRGGRGQLTEKNLNHRKGQRFVSWEKRVNKEVPSVGTYFLLLFRTFSSVFFTILLGNGPIDNPPWCELELEFRDWGISHDSFHVVEQLLFRILE